MDIPVADLTACDREPIQTPGSIQPYGIMLVAEATTLRVRHVAGEVERRLGVDQWEGSDLARLIGPALAERIAAQAETGGAGFVGTVQAASGEMLDVSVQRGAAYLLVELEPAPADPPLAAQTLAMLEAVASGFEQAGTLQGLCERAALEFRRLTGFDRVMVYRFLESEAGMVVAEDRRQDLHSFLNQHFPATDIPRQARVLYQRNLIRVIPDAAYQSAPVRPEWTETEPLDMSDSSLRSVSPIHLQYLANMGVRASASISIVTDGALWGLIACHHEAPRHLPLHIRATCRALAGVQARQIKAKEAAEGYRQRIRLRSFEDDVVALLAREGSLDQALANHLRELGAIFGDGVAVLRGDELIQGGVTPEASAIRALASWVLHRGGGAVYATDALSQPYPPAQAFRDYGSGLLAITLSSEEPWLLMWSRVEHVEVINWAGNPHRHSDRPDDAGGADDPAAMLTPRASFAAWQETIRGRARRWTLPEIDAAARLRASLLEIRQNRHMRELNHHLTALLQDKDSAAPAEGISDRRGQPSGAEQPATGDRFSRPASACRRERGAARGVAGSAAAHQRGGAGASTVVSR